MKSYKDCLIDFIKTYYIWLILFFLYVIITFLFHIINCPIKLIIGIPCPGCGMSRAFFSLIKLDFSMAFYYNPLIFILPIIMFIIVFNQRPKINKIYKSNIFWISIILIFLISYVLRFIFIYPNEPMDFNSHSLYSIIFNFIKNIFN